MLALKSIYRRIICFIVRVRTMKYIRSFITVTMIIEIRTKEKNISITENCTANTHWDFNAIFTLCIK